MIGDADKMIICGRGDALLHLIDEYANSHASGPNIRLAQIAKMPGFTEEERQHVVASLRIRLERTGDSHSARWVLKTLLEGGAVDRFRDIDCQNLGGADGG